jgi:hypothetical protein
VFFTHVTVFDVDDSGPAGVVFNVTVFVEFLRNVREVVTPVAEPPPLKVQLYPVAPVELLALNVHVRPLQL